MNTHAANLKRNQALEGIIDLATTTTWPIGKLNSQDWIAKQFGLSRTPVREALALHKHDGTLTQIPQVGTVVHHVAEQDVAELLWLRAGVATVAVSKLAQRKPLKNLHLVSLGFEDTVSTPDDVLKRDDAIHQAIIADADMVGICDAAALCGVRRRLFYAEQPLNEATLLGVSNSGRKLVDELLNTADTNVMVPAVNADYLAQSALLGSGFLLSS